LAYPHDLGSHAEGADQPQCIADSFIKALLSSLKRPPVDFQDHEG
jgi:hypothetical protein